MSAYSSNSTIPGAAATEPLVAKPQGRIRKGVVVAAAVASLMLVGGLAGLAAVARRPPARRRVGRRLTVDESPAQADASRRFLSFIAPSIFELDLPEQVRPKVPKVDPAQPRRTRLPAGVDTLVLDVGAKSSLAFSPEALPRHQRNGALVGRDNVAVVAFEPVLENLQVLYDGHRLLPPEYRSRRFVVPAAVAETDAVGEFHLSVSSACGSILATDPANRFWCHNSMQVAHVPVVSVASRSTRTPRNRGTPTIDDYYSKYSRHTAERLYEHDNTTRRTFDEAARHAEALFAAHDVSPVRD